MYPFRRARVLMDSDMILTEPGPDDTPLTAAYRSGDDEALTALIQRHQTSVYRLAVGVLASREEAEDAAQEALMSMLTSLHRFRGEARVSTWLYRLTLNICLKRRRSRGARLVAGRTAGPPPRAGGPPGGPGGRPPG